jgi:hypothetical protein
MRKPIVLGKTYVEKGKKNEWMAERWLIPGLPDGIFSYQKSQFEYMYFVVPWNWKSWYVLFDTWNIIRQYDITYGRLVNFVVVWYIVPRKTWQPRLILRIFFDIVPMYVRRKSQALYLHWQPKLIPWRHKSDAEQGCQMAYFLTKNQTLGKFWRDLLWKMLVSFMDILSILGPFGLHSL